MNKDNQFGFSDIRIWPYYGFVSAAVLYLSTHFNIVISAIIVAIPSYFVLKIFIKYDNADLADIDSLVGIDRYEEMAKSKVARQKQQKDRLKVQKTKGLIA